MINDFFKESRKLISIELERFLGKEKRKLGDVPWGREVSGRMLKFCLGGKMFRGGLVILAYEIFGGKPHFAKASRGKEEAVRAGVAVELLQSGLLIHDDIIDRDLLRRGEKSIFAEYGSDLAICIGDAGYFFSYKILPESLKEIFSRKSIEVMLGQIRDVSAGQGVNEKDILNIYLYKTASYSCSLPLMMGAILADTDDETVLRMEELGKYLGIIFQMKDDEMGLFGEEKEIGKPVGGDIKEGKKTLYYLYLFERARGEELKRLKKVFGNKNISKGDVLFVREMIKKLGVDKEINRKLLFYEKKARELIGDEPRFLELLELSLKRKR